MLTESNYRGRNEMMDLSATCLQHALLPAEDRQAPDSNTSCQKVISLSN